MKAACQKRRKLLGLLAAGPCLAAPAIAATPIFTMQSEDSLAHCEALVRAALKAVGFSAEFIKAPNATEERNMHEMLAGRIHLNMLPASPSRLALSSEGKMRMLAVPLERGLLGWRTAFVLQHQADKLAQVRSSADLAKFVVGQGPSWWDLEVYRAAAIPAREIQDWRDGDFAEQMRAGAIDLFPMGMEEALSYFLPHFQKKFPDLVLDRHLLLRYPWYRFLWVSASPAADELHQALRAGFDAISANGIFEKVWQQTRSLPPKSAWQERRLIELPNPFYNRDIVPLRYQRLLLDHPAQNV